MIFNQKYIFQQYPWLKEKNHKFIISADYDGLICSAFLSHFLNWELVGYYNLYSDLMSHWNRIIPDFIFNIN